MFIFRKKKDPCVKGSQTPAGRSSSELPSFTSLESSLARVIALENILVGNQKQTRQNTKSLEKRHFQVLMSEKVSFSEKSNIFQSLLSTNKLSPKLLEILFEWRYKYMSKKRFLSLLLEVVSNNLSFFENTEINGLVEMVCQICENSEKENYRISVFAFLSRIVQLPFALWTEQVTRTLCKCFSGKKSFEVFHYLIKSTACFVQLMALVKALEDPDTRFNALFIIREVIKEKNQEDKFKDFRTEVLFCILRCDLNDPERSLAEELIKSIEYELTDLNNALVEEVKKKIKKV